MDSACAVFDMCSWCHVDKLCLALLYHLLLCAYHLFLCHMHVSCEWWYVCECLCSHVYTCVDVIMKAITPLLLCLLSALVEVHSQTAPYLTFMGKNIPNNSYVDFNTVGETIDTNTLQCHTDLNTCCNSGQGPDRGDWYFPNGNRLQYSGIVYERCFAQLVVVFYTGSGGTSGIYRCDIETVSGVMTVLNNAVTAQYCTHTLTVTGRLGGEYQCNVTNNKPSTATAQLTVQSKLIKLFYFLSLQI